MEKIESELIRREDVIETVYQLRHKPNDEDWEQWLYALLDIPTADRPQEWIPCSERLPKPYTEVLVCDECGWISLGSYRPCDVTEKDSGWSTLTRIKLPTDEVLAWMPLPKPWKGADDE